MTPKPRRFADFRPQPLPAPIHDQEPIDKVVMRLFAGSGDGLRVLAWMLAETGKTCTPNADDRALREAEGARRFIAEIHQMAQGSYVPSRNS